MKTANPAHLASVLFNFLKEVKTEAKRVNWPTREKTIKDTIIVIIFAVTVAAFLSTFDYVFQYILSLVIPPPAIPVEALPSDAMAPIHEGLPIEIEPAPGNIIEGTNEVVPEAALNNEL